MDDIGSSQGCGEAPHLEIGADRSNVRYPMNPKRSENRDPFDKEAKVSHGETRQLHDNGAKEAAQRERNS